VRTKLSSEHGKTQLNQGFLVHPRKNGAATPRGEGFELRTDNAGAIRASQGLLLSTEDRHAAQGKHLDRKLAQSQLEAARDAAGKMSSVAKHQMAQATEVGPDTLNDEGEKDAEAKTGHLCHFTDAVRSLEAHTNTDPQGETAAGGQAGQQPVLLLSSAAGIGLATEQEIVLASGMNLDTVSTRDTQQTTGRRWIHNAVKKISLFVEGVADKVNLMLTAAKGHARLWAQAGNVEITGEKNVNVSANQEAVTVFGGKEVLLTSGEGYIRIKDGNIEIHCPGQISFKSAGQAAGGPTSLNMPPAPPPEPKACSPVASVAAQQGGATVPM
jgi:type VI secretion system secreted protein VgrG